MKWYPLPKEFHPDFAISGRKPIGPVCIDKSSSVGKYLNKDCVIIYNPPNLEVSNTNEFFGGINVPIQTSYTDTLVQKANKRTNLSLDLPPNGASAANGYISTLGNDAPFSGLTECTVLMVAARHYYSGVNARTFASQTVSGASSGVTCTDDDFIFRVQQGSYGNARSINIAIPDKLSLVDGLVHGVAWIWRGGSDMEGFLDGVSAGSDGSTDSVSSIFSYPTTAYRFLEGGSYQQGVNLEYLLVIPKALPEKVVRQWTLTPYRDSLKPANPLLYAVPDTGSTPYSADLTSQSFGFTANSLSYISEYNADFTSGSVGFTPNSLSVSIDVSEDLTTPSVDFTAQSLTLTADYLAELTSASLAITPQSLSLITDENIDLTAASFGLSANDIDVIVGIQLDLTSESFDFTPAPLSLTADFIGDLTAESFDFTPLDLAYNAVQQIDLTSSSFNFVGLDLDQQADFISSLSSASFALTTNSLAVLADQNIDLTTASFEFTAHPVTVTSETASEDLTTAIFYIQGKPISYVAEGESVDEEGILGIMRLVIRGPVKDLIKKRNR